MFRIIAFAIGLSLCAMAVAGPSIFDDDFKQNDSGAAPKELPRRQYTPQRTPAPANPMTDDKPAPAMPTEKPSDIANIKPSDPTANQSPVDAEAVQKSIEARHAKMRKAAEQVIADILAKSSEIKAAQKRVDQASDKTRNARITGDSVVIADASRELLDAKSSLKVVANDVIQRDPAGKKAADFLAEVDKEERIKRLPRQEPEAERPPEIAEAIRERTFINGMTFRDACRAARIPWKLAWSQGNEKIYRWEIGGTVGVRNEGHVTPRGVIYEQTPIYGLIAFVEARFVDDAMVEFGKFTVNGGMVQQNTINPTITAGQIR
jgi:hypothetical protein